MVAAGTLLGAVAQRLFSPESPAVLPFSAIALWGVLALVFGDVQPWTLLKHWALSPVKVLQWLVPEKKLPPGVCRRCGGDGSIPVPSPAGAHYVGIEKDYERIRCPLCRGTGLARSS